MDNKNLGYKSKRSELRIKFIVKRNCVGFVTDVIQTMQNDYIGAMLADTSVPFTLLIAEYSETSLGFIHVKAHKDEISEEMCAMVTLLAVSPSGQGKGIGKLLMQAAEQWTKQQGYRLLHLEVFANNDNAQGFYNNLGFKPEMMTMVKAL